MLHHMAYEVYPDTVPCVVTPTALAVPVYADTAMILAGAIWRRMKKTAAYCAPRNVQAEVCTDAAGDTTPVVVPATLA